MFFSEYFYPPADREGPDTIQNLCTRAPTAMTRAPPFRNRYEHYIKAHRVRAELSDYIVVDDVPAISTFSPPAEASCRGSSAFYRPAGTTPISYRNLCQNLNTANGGMLHTTVIPVHASSLSVATASYTLCGIAQEIPVEPANWA